MKHVIKKAVIPVIAVVVICLGVTTAYVLNNNEIKLSVDYDSNPPYTEMVLQFSKDIFIVSDIDAMKKDIAQKLSITFNPTLDYVIKPLDSRNCIVEIYNPKPAHEYHFTMQLNNITIDEVDVLCNNEAIVLGKDYFFKTPVLHVNSCFRESNALNSPITIKFNFPVSLTQLKQHMTISNNIQYTMEYAKDDNTKRTVIVKPSNEAKATQYTLRIDKSMVPINGVIGMDTFYVFHYETFKPFELESIKSSYNSSFYPDYPVEFVFNNDIAIPQGHSIHEYVKVSPDPGGLQINASGQTISIIGNFIGENHTQ